MPRDSHLLSAFTQKLLREARKPRFAQPKRERAEEEKTEEDDETKNREVQVGWTAKKWAQVPRHAEEPEHEYLAKRRKGLPSSYAEAPAFVPQIATRTAKVRKLDAAGNATVYEVIVPEGQAVEGEVKDEDVSMVDAPTLAPGTVIEGVGVANAEGQVVAHDLLQPTPQRRRKPPPPKRKGGPGRGKKKVMFQPAPANSNGTAPVEGTAATPAADGTNTSTPVPGGSEQGGAQVEGEEEDVEEGEDGDEGDEDGDDREDGELSGDETPATRPQSQDTPAPVAAASTSVPSEPPADISMPDAPDASDALPPPVVSEPEPVPATEAATLAPPPAPEGIAEPAPTPVSAVPAHLSIPEPPLRSASSSPDLPLAKQSHSRQNSASNIQAGSPAEHDIPGLGTLPSAAEETPNIPAPIPAPPSVEEPEKTEEIATAAVANEPSQPIGNPPEPPPAPQDSIVDTETTNAPDPATTISETSQPIATEAEAQAEAKPEPESQPQPEVPAPAPQVGEPPAAAES